MVTTRIAPRPSDLGETATTRRHRVDPLKLLALIERVKTAAGNTSAATPAGKSQPAAKAG